MNRCRRLQNRYNLSLSITDIAGRGIGKAKTYLTKVCQVDFSFGDSAEWNEIQDYQRLRNHIVHNGGIIYKSTTQSAVEAYVSRKPDLFLSEGDINEILLGEVFCAEVIETVAVFLYNIDAAVQERGSSAC